MSAFGAAYVIDNNTLGQLSRSQRATSFFRENVRIASEVLHEARGFPDIEDLQRNEYKTTRSVICQLMRVMATITTTDTSLVDLYANRGNADPIVIACALDGQDQDSQYLDAPEWFVVTGDKAVRAKAEEFALQVISNAEFESLIENSTSQPASHPKA